LAFPLAAASTALATSVAQAQVRVTGVVTATTGEPLAAVTVQAVGTTAGTLTNDAGRYTLTVPAGATTIRFRRIGYQQRQATLTAGQTEVNAQLERDVLQLEQVVVTGQTTTTTRRNATTAIAAVSSEEVTRAPAPSLESALQGKVIGATINMNSGAPGGGGQIQIRGASSILGASDPLFVVDGVIISNASASSGLNAVTRAGGNTATSTQDNRTNRLSDINPNEIESIEVLKSAAATAIYGSRATNGVIVIRTKRGQPGQTVVNVTQRVGTQNALNLNGQRRFTSVEQALSSGADSAAVVAAFANGIPEYQDFQKQLYSNNDPAYETLASVSGGTERTTYRVSGSQKLDRGIAINTSARLQGLRTALSQNWSKVTAEVGINLIRNTYNRGVSNNDNTGTSPLYIFGYTPSIVNLRQRDSTGRFQRNPFNCPVCSNPFETFTLLKATENVYRGLGSYNVNWTALESTNHRVTLGVNGGFDRFQQEGEVYSPGFLQYESQDGRLGEALQVPTSGRNLNNQVVGTYTFTGSGLTATLSGGGAQEEQTLNQLSLRGSGLLPGVGQADQGVQEQTQTQQFFRDQAVFGNVQVTAFGERLTLLGGVRADRSSANGDPAKFYVFPRASASYRLDVGRVGLEDVKFRAGFGQTGNRPNYGSRDILLGTGTILDGNATLIRGAAVGNPNIRPETLNEQEYGLDVTALGSRLQFEGTFFDRNITNLLLQPSTAFSTGYTSLFINAGELNTRGYEFGLTAVPIQARNLTWTSRATYQTYAQEVRNLPNSVPAFAVPGSFGANYGRNRIQPGARATAIWGNAPVRTDATGKVLEVLPVGSYVTNPSAVSTQRDTIVGDANPDFQMFFTNSVTFKRLSANFLVDWRKGGDVSNMTNNLWDEGGQSYDYDRPSPVDTLTLGAYRYAAFAAGRDSRPYIQDGGFVKLREVSLTYDLPTGAFRRVSSRINSVRVNLQGRNLAIWTDYWGAEPESSNFGNSNFNRFIDLAVFPTPRQFFLSLDVGF
jgi:TonB-linked SusC/RagA family outer membrane protein